ncbi:MAG: cyclic nucleotide-binding domain-containing protein, partial [Pseudomonadota bacterium]
MKDRAVSWVAKGRYGRALEVYQSLSEIEPKNPRWSLKMGEMYKKLNKPDQAIEVFGRASNQYAKQGFLLKAIAACDLVLGIDPEHQDTQTMLAKLCARKSGETVKLGMPADSKAHSPPLMRSGAHPIFDVEQALAEHTKGTRPPVLSTKPSEVEETKRNRRPTIPPGAAMDSVDLGEFLSAARKQESDGVVGSGVVEIQLEDELDNLFTDMVLQEDLSPKLPDIPPTPLFSSLDADSLRTLIERVSVRRFVKGARIITQGESGNSLFVVAEGEVIVFQKNRPLKEAVFLGEGSFFGEIAVITNSVRTATVEATRET